MITYEREYETARSSVAAMWIDRDVLRVTGADAESYLQGQLSQNVARISVGTGAWSFLLQPHGKVDALVRVSFVGDHDYVIDCDAGFGALVRQRLERFKLRTKVDIEPLDWKALAIRGPESPGVRFDKAVIATANWPGSAGFDALGSDLAAPRGVTVCSADIFEVLRIESGMPQMGREMDDKTIPAEAGINDLAIDFAKGCYTGQELVARIDSRGNNVPKRLQTVVINGIAGRNDLPPTGSRLFPIRKREDAKPAGVLSSVAFSPRINAAVGLAMVRRDLSPAADALLEVDDVRIPCRIEAAPLVS